MTLHRYRGAAAIALSLGLLISTAPVPYQTRVVNAVDTCARQHVPNTYPAMRDCVRSLAAPNPGVQEEIDLWNAFLDCLAEFYRSLDDIYPTGRGVNECLEDMGFDVGP
jgi:hypothetical protein